MDDKALTYAFHSINPNTGAHVTRELRQMPYIAELTTNIRHVSEEDNAAASYAQLCERRLPTTLATAQRSDPEWKRLLKSTTSALKLQRVDGPTGSICCDMSTVRARPFVPPDLHRNIYEYLYGISHPGIPIHSAAAQSYRFVCPE
ncbi:hypothetical protein MRX96_052497 [Rhipicephalus microplus]